MSTPQHIAQNIQTIEDQLPTGCNLIVVSKYRGVEEIEAAYASGQRLFAENRVQALLERKEALPADIEWHLIGHLQTNKVKYITPFISMIHAVDSIKLLQEINKEAAKSNRVIPCLVQLHIAQEETKFGLDAGELDAFFVAYQNGNMTHVTLSGLMAMASNTDDRSQIAAEFAQVQSLFRTVKDKYFPDQAEFCELSIGMSSDYDIAIAHGSTLVRVGSAVFA
ncbi:MAG: YggS family pyridoxal phosphate-dependent enzyme [Bacteroidota bacterium]|jgi:pyridoxal phosphate enzyme (YggS family)